jgi:NADH dehydrogenase [ubiquinone] 1 alpha subcomplex assembly factor 7
VGSGCVVLLVCAEQARQRETVNPLKEKILRLVRQTGPITLAQYMQMALLDPEHGYYVKRDPLGRDFITAPEISQIFGELIGLFFVQAWEDRGRPGRFRLVELGPGRGTLMADALRAAGKVRPDFVAAAQIVLVEMSPSLRAIQARTLENHEVQWAATLGEVPNDAPLFLVANEFFDALPARQFIRSTQGWHERLVSADGEALVFAATPDTVPQAFISAPLRDASVGAVFETSPASQSLAQEIGQRIARQDGLALIIDYGHAMSALGDTFQAVKAHAYADPLAEPGDADLTFHVDFAALSQAARSEKAYVFGPIGQGEFLDALGIRLRAERLKRAAPERSAEVDAAIDRLTNPAQMGTLFKAMAICEAPSPGVPGFPC